MMQPTDTVPQPASSTEVQAVESGQALLDVKDDRSRPDLPPHSSEIPYAAKLLAISSTVGVGAILLGQGLWQPDTKAARLPAPEDMGVNRPSQPSLRDRVPVTTLRSAPLRSSALSPPDSLPLISINATRPNQLKPSTELPTARISHGFDNAGQAPVVATLPVPTFPIPTFPTSTFPIPTQAVPTQAAPTQAAPQTPPAIAIAPPAPPAPRQTPTQPADRPPAVITSLLHASEPRASEPRASEPRASESHPNPSIEQTVVDRKPSQATVPVGRETAEQSVPAALPAPSTAVSMKLATIRLTTLEQTSASPEGVSIEPIAITGNTRFSSKELVDVVQQAIADTAQRLSVNHDPIIRSLSPTELQQAGEAITQFYTAHGYTNVAVEVSTAALNGATPAIRIVESSLDSDRLLPH